MGRYAEGTEVSVQSSQQEIGRTLSRYNVETYHFGQSPGTAIVAFETKGVQIKVGVPLPKRPGPDDTYTAGNGRAYPKMNKWEQEVKEAWRALALLIKANLEAVERGIISVEQAFMAFLMLPGEQMTVGERVLPAYAKAVEAGSRLALTASK